jgi:hypothetical protein
MKPRPLPKGTRGPFQTQAEYAQAKYDADRFKTKSRGGDYLIYGLIIGLLLAITGGTIYYFTRSPQEQSALRTKFDRFRASLPFMGPKDGAEKPPRIQRKDPRMEEGILSDAPSAPAVAPAAPVAPPPPLPPPVKSSAYAGEGQTGVRPSKNAQAPAASQAFTLYAQSLKVSAVVAGNPPRIVINGRVHTTGETLNAELGVVLVSLDSADKHLLLRDRTRAELLLYY